MCGRYVLKSQDLAALLIQLGVTDPHEFTSRYNIAPSTPIPTLRTTTAQRRELAIMQWGLIPSWSKHPATGARLANAHAEGIATKPAFRHAFRSRRCVVPASGFYEWQTCDRRKLPWYFQMHDERPCLLAAIWETFRGPDGSTHTTCALITTTPNEVVRPLHDRMPVILREAALDVWLDPSVTTSDALTPLLTPLPAPLMKASPVSTRVNQVRHEGSDCLLPAPAPTTGSPQARTDGRGEGEDGRPAPAPTTGSPQARTAALRPDLTVPPSPQLAFDFE